MAYKNQIKAIPLKSIDSATGISGSYAAINSTGLPNSCTILRIINNSTKDVTVSYDGTNDHDYVPTLTTLAVNAQTNAQYNNVSSVFQQGTIVYVKGTAGTGNIYLAGYFNPSAG